MTSVTPAASPSIQPLGPSFSTESDVPIADHPAQRDVDNNDNRQALKAALAHRRNVQTLARRLHEIAVSLAPDASASAVSSALKSTRMTIEPNSTFHHRNVQVSAHDVSLESFIASNGTYMPATREDLFDMADTLLNHGLSHPLGNLSGSLSWALPLSLDHQRTVHDVVACNTESLPGLPLLKSGHGALGYLLEGQLMTTDDLQDPVKAIEKLLDSPKAQALGMAGEIGTLAAGKAADLAVWDITRPAELAYWLGKPLLARRMVGGVWDA